MNKFYKWICIGILGFIILTIGNYLLYTIALSLSEVFTPSIIGILTTIIPLIGFWILIISIYNIFICIISRFSDIIYCDLEILNKRKLKQSKEEEKLTSEQIEYLQ